MISAERMRHVLYVKKPLEMHVLLGDVKTPQTFTKEHYNVLHVINVLQSHRVRAYAHVSALKIITSMMARVHMLT